MSSDAQATVRDATHVGHILLVDDGSVPADRLAMLSRVARRFTPVVSGVQALELVAAGGLDTLLVGEALADMSGREFLVELQSIPRTVTVIMLVTNNRDADELEELRSLGADLLLHVPLTQPELLAAVALSARLAELEAAQAENAPSSAAKSAVRMIGCSPQSRRLTSVMARVAETSTTVLIEGREGTGKSLLGRVIHEASRRSSRPLVTLPCDGVGPEQLELALVEANGGTLLLEAIEMLPAAAQQRLVKHMKERSPRSETGDNLDVRLVATTSAHLPEHVARGQFREDLFYRLNVFPIHVPSLQERRDDIGLLATHFLRQSADLNGLPEAGFTSAAMILLETHPWPGNVAQLQSAVLRAHALSKGSKIDRDHLLGPTTGLELEQELPVSLTAPTAAARDDGIVREAEILPMEVEEKRILARALRATSGNVRRAAQLLRIGRATLYRKIQVYDLRLN